MQKALVGDQKISLAVDVWSSPNHYAFLGAIAYMITPEWELKSFVLGFEPLSGRHTGNNLATIILKLLEYYNIKDRLLAITTDNASNNGTMRTELQDQLKELSVEWESQVGTIPCMAHVIQLVVGELVKCLSVTPTNDKVNEVFNEDDIDAMLNSDNRLSDMNTHCNVIKKVRDLKVTQIGNTLIIFIAKQIRLIAIAIFASPQRTESFLELQPENPRVIKQDCKTRWSSTVDMLSRAYLLRKYIDEWLRSEGNYRKKFLKLRVSKLEWNHVQYMITLLQPFKQWTNALSKTKSVVIHQAWIVYNQLYDHLDDAFDKFNSSHASGEIYRSAIDAARKKLSTYYSKTTTEGLLYNLACILDPSNKLTLYKTSDWKDYQTKYTTEFNNYFKKYYKPQVGSSNQLAIAPAPIDDFTKLALQYRNQSAAIPTNPFSEVKGYITSPVLQPRNPLDNWRQIQAEYPNLARMARDVYSVSLAETEAERLFSIARRVCRWDRASLDPHTIQMIMVVKLFNPELVVEEAKEEQEEVEREANGKLQDIEVEELRTSNLFKFPTLVDDSVAARFPELRRNFTTVLNESNEFGV
jgi:hypothetical protein